MVFAMTFGALPAYAFASPIKENQEATLTVSEAAKMAINEDSAVKNLNDTEDLSGDKLEQALDNMHDSFALGESAMLNAQVNYMSLELSSSLAIKDITARKENVEYSITKYFNTIINAEKALELFDSSLDIQKRELDITKLKLNLGMVSQLDYDTALLNFERAGNSRLVYVNSIDKAYRDLNGAMGKPLENRYNLVLNLEYKPIEEINITQYTDTFLNKSLTIKRAEDAKDVAEFQMDNYIPDYDIETREIYEDYNKEDQLLADFNQASRSLADIKLSVKESIIDTYNSLRDMEVDIKAGELELQTSNQQLTILEKRLALGQVTALDVDKLKYDIKNKEDDLRKTKNNYVLTVIAFKNPNLLTAAL
jgi:hypothetical protein